MRLKGDVRQFKSSEKAVIDIGLYSEGTVILTDEKRKRLQEQVISLENQLLNLKRDQLSYERRLPPS